MPRKEGRWGVPLENLEWITKLVMNVDISRRSSIAPGPATVAHEILDNLEETLKPCF